MADRDPTLWEAYEMIFQSLEQGRATFKEAREFHRLMLLGPSERRMGRFIQLRKKLGVGMIAEGQITLESLLAWAKDTEKNVRYDSEVVSEKIEEIGEEARRGPSQVRPPSPANT